MPVSQQIPTKTFDTGKISINYFEGPDNGPSVVLLHGGSGNWQHLGDLVLALIPRWHVYAPDLRGHGKSGRVPWGYSVREYAEDAGAFLREVSGPAALFGHSLGGIVAVMAAALYPRKVRALLVGDAPLDAVTWQAVLQGHRSFNQRLRSLSGGKHAPDEIIAGLKLIPAGAPGPDGSQPTWGDIYPDGHPIYEHFIERLTGHDPDVLGMLLEDYATAAAGYQMDQLLPSIQCPVLLMQADPTAGGAMTDDEAARAMMLLKHGQQVKFSGLSHTFYWDDLPRVTGVMERFLEQHTL